MTYEIRIREDPQASHSVRVSYPPKSCKFLFKHDEGVIDKDNVLSKSHGHKEKVSLEEVPEEVINKIEEEGYEC